MKTMIREINGKEIKITKAGYLYVDGIKQSEQVVTPINTITDDKDALMVCQEWNKKYWVMC
jgi:hypothetical protein